MVFSLKCRSDTSVTTMDVIIHVVVVVMGAEIYKFVKIIYVLLRELAGGCFKECELALDSAPNDNLSSYTISIKSSGTEQLYYAKLQNTLILSSVIPSLD